MNNLILYSYFHGCEKCFDPEDTLVDGRTCRELNESTQDRLRQLREPDQEGKYIQVEEIWVSIKYNKFYLIQT